MHCLHPRLLNLSGVTFDTVEIQLLSMGLNFSTSYNITSNDIKFLATESEFISECPSSGVKFCQAEFLECLKLERGYVITTQLFLEPTRASVFVLGRVSCIVMFFF